MLSAFGVDHGLIEKYTREYGVNQRADRELTRGLKLKALRKLPDTTKVTTRRKTKGPVKTQAQKAA